MLLDSGFVLQKKLFGYIDFQQVDVTTVSKYFVVKYKKFKSSYLKASIYFHQI